MNNFMFSKQTLPIFADLILIAKVALMTRLKVVFGELPEVTYRDIIVDAMSLEDLEKMNDHILQSTKEA